MSVFGFWGRNSSFLELKSRIQSENDLLFDNNQEHFPIFQHIMKRAIAYFCLLWLVHSQSSVICDLQIFCLYNIIILETTGIVKNFPAISALCTSEACLCVVNTPQSQGCFPLFLVNFLVEHVRGFYLCLGEVKISTKEKTADGRDDT